jgi:hypothetical protein
VRTTKSSLKQIKAMIPKIHSLYTLLVKSYFIKKDFTVIRYDTKFGFFQVTQNQVTQNSKYSLITVVFYPYISTSLSDIRITFFSYRRSTQIVLWYVVGDYINIKVYNKRIIYHVNMEAIKKRTSFANIIYILNLLYASLKEVIVKIA